MSNKYVLIESLDFPKLITYKNISNLEYKILKYFEYYNIKFKFRHNNVDYNIETFIQIKQFQLKETNNTLQKVFGSIYFSPIDICDYIINKYYYIDYNHKLIVCIQDFEPGTYIYTYCIILYLLLQHYNKNLYFFKLKIDSLLTIYKKLILNPKFLISDPDFNFIFINSKLYIFFYTSPSEYNFKHYKKIPFSLNYNKIVHTTDSNHIDTLTKILNEFLKLKCKHIYYITLDYSILNNYTNSIIINKNYIKSKLDFEKLNLDLQNYWHSYFTEKCNIQKRTHELKDDLEESISDLDKYENTFITNTKKNKNKEYSVSISKPQNSMTEFQKLIESISKINIELSDSETYDYDSSES